jgi:hypothetical protein
LSSAELTAWRAALPPRLQKLVDSSNYQALLGMPDETIARAWFRSSLWSVFYESLREVLRPSKNIRERIFFRELEALLSRVPFSLSTTVFGETVNFFDCETRPLSPP